ncbi:hypothetical protein EHW66_16005 [Erwinia psidii]|uniref:hypothetical protein n=1 Tax=Erwinia psidii TaxID=69224 RepID=UPI00226B2EF5|nr:hypothetical protein [Erwinia psidii]MCX8966423.1 hypothetical protein [Erwinia psidii]
MKFGLPVTATLLIATAVQAEDYRVVYSPSMELEVFIDNVPSSAPRDWCKENIQLRIVSGNNMESNILNSFLPRVGTLLQNQCGKLEEMPWQMTNDKGAVVATGTAAKEQSWRPVVIADASEAANITPGAAQPASRAPLSRFTLPTGCYFRTSWEGNGKALFIPEDKNLACSSGGWLEGKSVLTLSVKGKNQQVPVQFYQGFPLRKVHPAPEELNIVSANNQRLIVSKKAIPDSWLVLIFDPVLHVWSFEGSLLLKMKRSEADDPLLLKQRVASVLHAWNSVVDQQIKINVLLVDGPHVGLADPTIGAWRTVN